MCTLCVIPARYASTRLPGKPLADLGGVPLICRVYARAAAARTTSGTLVATDDDRIAAVVASHGGQALLTRSDHPSGTDRVAEIARITEAEIYVNVQGDEPFVRPADIDALVTLLETHPAYAVASLYHVMRSRLAFAISMAVDFDCYMIDEVTAVGDDNFSKKCKRALLEDKNDRSLILVSHSPGVISEYCNCYSVLYLGMLSLFKSYDDAFYYYNDVSSRQNSMV